MKPDSRVVSFSIPPWDDKTRNNVKILKESTKRSSTSFSDHICKAINSYIKTLNESPR